MNPNLSKSSGISSKQLLFILLFIETLATVVAIATAMKEGESLFHYFDEGRFMTYFSCLQLLIVSAFAWKIFRLEKKSSSADLVKNAVFWLMVCLGTFYLALDDALSIHEEIDKSMHRLFNIEETLVTDLADDIIVGIYLIIALVYIFSQWQNLQLFRSSFVYFKVGFVLGAIMVLADILSNNTLFVSMVTDDSQLANQITTSLGVFEETAKIIAEGFFLVGVYQCWQKISQQSTVSSEQ